MNSADIRGMFAGLPGAHGIIEAALNGQGRVMTDDSARPSSAAVLAGDFLFLGGEPSEELVQRALNAENRAWIVQGSSAFLALVQAQRSGTWSERIAFDPHRQPEDAHLTALLANLPQGVTLVPIGAAEMAFCRKTPWAADFVNQFTEDEYARSGLGVLVCTDGAFVSGASSYAAYPGGIEVEVDTAPAHRGYGYATLAAAKLILTAHQQGKIATWDAANETSAHIAQKLGYRVTCAYQVFTTA